MSHAPQLTRVDRANRHRKIVARYQTGLSSRAVASEFGLSDGHVRFVLRLYEAKRPRDYRARA